MFDRKCDGFIVKCCASFIPDVIHGFQIVPVLPFESTECYQKRLKDHQYIFLFLFFSMYILLSCGSYLATPQSGNIFAQSFSNSLILNTEIIWHKWDLQILRWSSGFLWLPLWVVDSSWRNFGRPTTSGKIQHCSNLSLLMHLTEFLIPVQYILSQLFIFLLIKAWWFLRTF